MREIAVHMTGPENVKATAIAKAFSKSGINSSKAMTASDANVFLKSTLIAISSFFPTSYWLFSSLEFTLRLIIPWACWDGGACPKSRLGSLAHLVLADADFPRETVRTICVVLSQVIRNFVSGWAKNVASFGIPLSLLTADQSMRMLCFDLNSLYYSLCIDHAD